MWCELVLNGIGGRTVAEAKERLSLSEFQMWVEYRNKCGSFNEGMRTEWGAALVSSMIGNVNRDPEKSEPFSIADFAPHIEKPAISLKDAMSQWN
ncbi:phage tail protein [Enterobacterales bacterium CwR94]|nr:phage tail protein [Enterobacterales bacterium CwR94]